MLIEITYNVTDVFMSTTETPVYVEISFEQPGSASAVWGSITGTLSNQTDLQNALNAKLDDPTGTTLQYIDGTGGLQTFPLTLPVLQEVRNQTGATLTAGTVVYINGATGNKPTVTKAIATGDATSAQTLGMISAAIANNGVGYVVVIGTCGGLDTSAYTEGQQLYLSYTTAGAVTTTKPYAPNHLVYVGIVTRSHPNLGTVEVRVQNGFEMDEIHNVSAQTPSNNDGLFYNTTTSLWESKSITTALGYTPVPTTRNITINGVTYDLSADRTWTIAAGISGSGAAGQVTYWTGASAVSGSNNLFWDNANGRLGIGTNAFNATKFQIGASSASIISGLSTPVVLSTNENDALNYTLAVASSSSVSHRGVFLGIRSRGTIASPLSVANGDELFALIASGYDGTGNNTRGGIFFKVDGAVSTGNVPTSIVFANGTTSRTDKMQLFSSGNLVLQNGGTFTDAGQRLQVYGDTLLRGSGATSATTALTVQNSSSSNLIRILNDGTHKIGGQNIDIYPTANGSTLSNGGRGLIISTNASSQTDAGALKIIGGYSSALGSDYGIWVSHSFTNGTGGVAIHNGILLNQTINQTGGANGITRGLYVNPTLTAAADFRAIETTAGNVLFGASGTGFFWDNTNGRLGIGTNAPAVNLDIIGASTGSGNAYLRVQRGSNTLGDAAFVTQPQGTLSASNVSWNYGLQANSNNFRFWYYNGTTTATALNITNTGNVHIGSGTDATVRLQVSGDTLLRGSGATSATTALTVQNSDSNPIFYVENNGGTYVRGRGAANVFFVQSSAGGNLFYIQNAGVIGFTTYTWTPEGTSASVILTASASRSWNISGDKNNTSGVGSAFFVTSGFNPTSGTGVYNAQTINPTINQTGGANGITRGLYVNPTLTSAADFRAIETTNGKIVFGNLPTSSAGLPTGALWNDAGTVKIV